MRTHNGGIPGIRKDFISDYDGLAGQWWDPRGSLAPLGWIARARAGFVPDARREGARLLDIACGGGLFGPHAVAKGYRAVGVDLSELSLREARRHGYADVVRADAADLPFDDGHFDVVTAGQCLEHVPDPFAVVAEACRVLRPGGTLVVDTIADTRTARFASITLAENVPIPGHPPRGTHDHRLFVNRRRLVRVARLHGVELTLHGLRPRLRDMARYAAGRLDAVRIVRTRSTSVLYLGAGTKK
ncbi:MULTISPECIES: methyltransferase domain-containing protein [Streptomyces]|uniref:methyltransferase domain-containing protein n=1 Tax=Streptomyces TaxID=1883 RepID=UPI001CCBC853|nr:MULTISPECIES: methyltransferase domain-containing protein [Streptomyces]UBI35087.1 methyltransferase domain-containing protein [Streptomyces mobaraensis]UKW27680.1 methyltransferase domain-containing protein [Streptomyces sp. TYQ1024]